MLCVRTIARLASGRAVSSTIMAPLANQQAALGVKAATVVSSGTPATIGDIIRHVRGDNVLTSSSLLSTQPTATRMFENNVVECCMSGCVHCVLDVDKESAQQTKESMMKAGMSAFEELERSLNKS